MKRVRRAMTSNLMANLPTLNACLNATAALLLLLGFMMIRRRRVRVHAACMIGAFSVSVIFLISYLTYHYGQGVTRFGQSGWVRTAYLTILATHTVLAALVPFMAVATLWRALQRRFHQHRRIARWTLPIWLYVSITGVVVYWMLYHLK